MISNQYFQERQGVENMNTISVTIDVACLFESYSSFQEASVKEICKTHTTSKRGIRNRYTHPHAQQKWANKKSTVRVRERQAVPYASKVKLIETLSGRKDHLGGACMFEKASPVANMR
eukprot:2045831-Amphidinium_carterae.1